MAVGTLGVIALVIAVAVRHLTACRPWVRYLRGGRFSALGLSAGLCAVTFADAVSPWGTCCAALAVLVSLQALALTLAPIEQMHAEAGQQWVAGEPVWWRDFERSFRRYAKARRRRPAG